MKIPVIKSVFAIIAVVCLLAICAILPACQTESLSFSFAGAPHKVAARSFKITTLQPPYYRRLNSLELFWSNHRLPRPQTHDRAVLQRDEALAMGRGEAVPYGLGWELELGDLRTVLGRCRPKDTPSLAGVTC